MNKLIYNLTYGKLFHGAISLCIIGAIVLFMQSASGASIGEVQPLQLPGTQIHAPSPVASVQRSTPSNTLGASAVSPQILQDSLLLDSILHDTAQLVHLASLRQLLPDSAIQYPFIQQHYLDFLSLQDPIMQSFFRPNERQVSKDPVTYAAGMHKNKRQNWLLFTVLFLFFAVGFVRFFFSSDFHLIVSAYFQDRLLQQISKEDTVLTSWSFIFLYVIFSFTLALFISIYNGYVLQDLTFLKFSSFLKLVGIVAILFVLKITVIRFVAFVFEIQRLVREYVTVLYLAYFNAMLIFLPTILIACLIPSEYLQYVVWFAIVLTLLLFLFRMLKTGFHLVVHSKFSIFYLILYLCCLEIAPILILVRSIS